MLTKINCIIIDDEPLAQKGMEAFVSEIPFLHLAHTCDSAMHALEVISSQNIELMFLDIRMPKMSGLDFLKNVARPPLTIITTAYPDFALSSFELNVLDYLVKPIAFERFVKSVTKAKEYLELLAKNDIDKNKNNDYCFIRCESKYEKLSFEEIVFVEALQNYVVIHTKTKRLITYLTVKSIEEHLPYDSFIKINKSFIISIPKIDNISGNTIHIGAHSFNIGRAFREPVLERILNDRLVKRI
jgi:DNA-binding LytR/AlgR family response regulator